MKSASTHLPLMPASPMCLHAPSQFLKAPTPKSPLPPSPPGGILPCPPGTAPADLDPSRQRVPARTKGEGIRPRDSEGEREVRDMEGTVG